MKNKFIILMITMFLNQTAKSSSGEINQEMVEATYALVKAIKTDIPEESYKKGLRQTRYTSDKKTISGCAFIRKVF